MGWSEIRDAAGNVVGHVHVCQRGQRRKPCSVPECDRPASKLCDWPVERRGAKGTCDAALCSAHARHVGPDRDLCHAHARLHFSGQVQEPPPASSRDAGGASDAPPGLQVPPAPARPIRELMRSARERRR